MNEKYEFSEEWTEEELKDWEEKMSEPIHFTKLTAEDVKKLKSQRQKQMETPQKLMPAEKENPRPVQYSRLIIKVKNEKHEKAKRKRFIEIFEKLKQDEKKTSELTHFIKLTTEDMKTRQFQYKTLLASIEKTRTAEEELSEPIRFIMLTAEDMKPPRKKLVEAQKEYIPAYKLKSGK